MNTKTSGHSCLPRRYRILNLGAGVQSGAIYSLMVDGEIEPADYALFADTQDEPAWVYEQLEYLKTLDGPEIVTVTAGRIGDDLKNGKNSTGQRFASIPAHTTYKEGERGGMTRRQCTREYKIEPIERWMRRTMLGLAPRKRIPKDVVMTNIFGFSTDEPTRAVKMRIQYAKKGDRWACEFPLFDAEIMMTREDCRKYIEQSSGFGWRSSRCVFCPLQQNYHWREIRDHDPAGWERAVEVDAMIRKEGSIVNRGMDESMYVHKGYRPLDIVNLDDGQGTLFDDEGCDQGCFL